MHRSLICKLDHLVLTTTDIPRCISFYETLGFSSKAAAGRYELFAGDFKLNVHPLGAELSPHAQQVQPGSADLCFETSDLRALKAQLESAQILLHTGVVLRCGVRGEMQSFYLYDPDGNLIEFCQYF